MGRELLQYPGCEPASKLLSLFPDAEMARAEALNPKLQSTNLPNLTLCPRAMNYRILKMLHCHLAPS